MGEELPVIGDSSVIGESSSMLMNSMRERFLAMKRSVSLRSLIVEGRCFLHLSVAMRDNVASSSLEEDFLMVEMEGRTGTGIGGGGMSSSLLLKKPWADIRGQNREQGWRRREGFYSRDFLVRRLKQPK